MRSNYEPDLLEQYELPAEMIEPVSVPPGQD